MLICLFLASLSARAKTIRVAVLDTGFDSIYDNSINRCPGYLDRDFAKSDVFNPNHGTNVVGLIQKYAGGVDFCFILVKWWSPDSKNYKAFIQGLEYIAKIKPDIINISGGGNRKYSREMLAVKKIINNGTIIVAAAGNEQTNLNKSCNYYPACYDSRIIVVGAKDPNKTFSNYGSNYVDYVMDGNGTAYGITLKGTSQATAKVTGILTRKLSEKEL